jgi:acyl-CoA thioesterase FadM
MMVRRAELTWHGPVRAAEVLVIDASVLRWGTTSLDVGYEGRVGDRPVFNATLTYIGVAPGTTTPISPPEVIRHHLGEVG